MAERSQMTRRQRGTAQNLANQLAQMAVGVEAMFVGAALIGEPATGVIELDATSGSATVNGRDTDLALARYLRGWLVAELELKKLASSWLTSASVRIRYTQTFGNATQSDWADFRASARVESEMGETIGTFSNHQHLVRG